jgi:hypothetical protein
MFRNLETKEKFAYYCIFLRIYVGIFWCVTGYSSIHTYVSLWVRKDLETSAENTLCKAAVRTENEKNFRNPISLSESLSSQIQSKWRVNK